MKFQILLVWLEDEQIPATIEIIKFALVTIFGMDHEELDSTSRQTSFAYWEKTGNFSVQVTEYLGCEQYLVCTNAVIRAFARYVLTQDTEWKKQMGQLQGIIMDCVNQDPKHAEDDDDDDDDLGLHLSDDDGDDGDDAARIDRSYRRHTTSPTVQIKEENDNAHANENENCPGAFDDALQMTPVLVDNSHLNVAHANEVPALENDNQGDDDNTGDNAAKPPSPKRRKTKHGANR